MRWGLIIDVLITSSAFAASWWLGVAYLLFRMACLWWWNTLLDWGLEREFEWADWGRRQFRTQIEHDTGHSRPRATTGQTDRLPGTDTGHAGRTPE